MPFCLHACAEGANTHPCRAVERRGRGPNAEEKGEGEREIKREREREKARGRGPEVTAAPGPDQAVDGPVSVAFIDVI